MNSSYVERSEMGGAIPESCHSTVKAVPPTSGVPAAGTVNSTSANARWGAHAARRKRALDGRIAIVRIDKVRHWGRREREG